MGTWSEFKPEVFRRYFHTPAEFTSIDLSREIHLSHSVFRSFSKLMRNLGWFRGTGEWRQLVIDVTYMDAFIDGNTALFENADMPRTIKHNNLYIHSLHMSGLFLGTVLTKIKNVIDKAEPSAFVNRAVMYEEEVCSALNVMMHLKWVKEGRKFGHRKTYTFDPKAMRAYITPD